MIFSVALSFLSMGMMFSDSTPFTQDRFGMTPFLTAIEMGDSCAVRTIISASNDTIPWSHKDGMDGKTALHYVVHSPDSAMAKIVYDAAVRSPEFPKLLQIRDVYGRTPLMLSAEAHRADVVSAIFSKAMNDSYRAILTPDLEAMWLTATDKGDPELVSLLLQFKIKANGRSRMGGVTPLMYCVQQQSSLSLPEILALTDEINLVDSDRANALHHAASYRSSYAVAPLVARGIRVDQQNVRGETPIYVAAKTGDTKFLRALIAAGANVNLADSEGITPLMNAAKSRLPAAVQVLIAAGANVNAQDSSGMTAAMYATDYFATNSVKLLLRGGSDLNLRNKSGQTLLEYARAKEVTEIIRVLENYEF